MRTFHVACRGQWWEDLPTMDAAIAVGLKLPPGAAWLFSSDMDYCTDTGVHDGLTEEERERWQEEVER